MNVCGVEIGESRMALIVIASLGAVLLLALTGLGVWVEGRYQRSSYVRRNGRAEHWRTPEEREGDDD